MDVQERRRWRKMAQLSQMQLAVEAAVSQGAVSRWEQGTLIDESMNRRITAIVVEKAKQIISDLVTRQVKIGA